MIDILNGQIELVLVVLAGPAVLGATIGQYTQQRNTMLFEEGQHSIVEHIGGDQRVLAVIELGLSNFGVGVDEGLLVDSAYSFEGSNFV